MNVKGTIGTLVLACIFPIATHAFESGSTGADGDHTPQPEPPMMRGIDHIKPPL